MEFTEGAAVDLSEWFQARSALATLLGREIDLVEYRAVRNPYIRREIDRSREVVYAA